VNQTAFEGDYYEEQPADWTEVLDESTLEGLRKGKGAVGAGPNGMQIFVYRDGERLFAMSDRCSHRGCALHTGRVRDGNVNCPCHGSSFRLEDGSVVRGPATSPQPTFDVRARDGKIEIKARA
jgi:nitrite reductase/ring-hydroxylating ferredoxin subunit